MKIERGWNKPQPETKPAETTVWDQLADHIHDSGTWTGIDISADGAHSHSITDPGHSHGVAVKFLAIVASDTAEAHRVFHKVVAQCPGVIHWCVRLFGADDANAMRGLYFDGAVLSGVTAKDDIYKCIIHPALMDRNGWSIFV